jgi:RNA polymerase sigma factor (sigma-70 family)
LDDTTRCHWIATHILPHEAEVRNWLRRYVSSLTAADLDDLIQEAYARVWRADFATIANGRSYFYTVVRNVVLEQARRARIVPMERIGQIETLRIASEEPEPERRVGARQELERLLQIVATLPVQWRRAFELQKFRGFSQREIAREMGLAEKTVEKYLGLALDRILETLASEQDPIKGMKPPGVNGRGSRDTQD